MGQRMWLTLCGGMAFTAILAAADVTGSWLFVMETPGGERHAQVVMKVEGETVTGTWDSQELKGTFRHGQLELAFPFSSSEAELRTTLTVIGTLKEDTLSGTWSFGDYGGGFTATRTR
jgi:uncharacterized protein YndB with AHSA1/START domain